MNRQLDLFAPTQTTWQQTADSSAQPCTAPTSHQLGSQTWAPHTTELGKALVQASADAGQEFGDYASDLALEHAQEIAEQLGQWDHHADEEFRSVYNAVMAEVFAVFDRK